MSRHYCHNCNEREPSTLNENGNYECSTCSDDILCDDCGQRLEPGHDCD